MSRLTLTMIKPDAVKSNDIGNIIADITKAGFSINGLKMLKLSIKQASEFYAVHKGKHFYDELITFMTSGPIVAISLSKDNAIADFRTLIGNTNPAEAVDGSIRKQYGKDKTHNAIHASDSDDNAILETNFFFSKYELADLYE